MHLTDISVIATRSQRDQLQDSQPSGEGEMSNAIDFLERAGQDALLRRASHAEVELALVNIQIEPELRSAILDRDPSRLEALLGHGPLLCMQFPGKEDEEDGEEDDTEESPAQEGEGMALKPRSAKQLR
jgi:hypothetical protein